MRRLGRTVVVSVLLLMIAFAAPTSSAAKIQVEKVVVRFLARSTAVHNSWAGNQDVYLIELHTERSPQIVLSKLVDEYPAYAAPISTTALRSVAGAKLRVLRSSDCDVLYSLMPIRAAADDRIAILPEKLKFQPSLTEIPAEGAVLPCYRLVR